MTNIAGSLVPTHTNPTTQRIIVRTLRAMVKRVSSGDSQACLTAASIFLAVISLFELPLTDRQNIGRALAGKLSKSPLGQELLFSIRTGGRS